MDDAGNAAHNGGPSEEELRVLQLFPPFSLDICPDSM
ncbi:hypothetical protein HaLaN_33161, partial [Haematococcus lacustris]